MSNVGKVRSEESERRFQLVLGVIAAFVVTVILAGTAIVYFFPYGEKRYQVRQYVSGGLKSGDSVRMAGVEIGQVRSVALEGDHVLVKFDINNDIRVGDQSSTEVKLLTPIGGHYLDLKLKGKEPLGDKTIPVERSHSPFDEFGDDKPQDPLSERKPWEVLDVVDKATGTIQQINVGNLHKVLDIVTKALDSQPDVIRVTIDAFAKVIDLLISREEQLRQAVSVVHEYLKEFGMEKDMLRQTLHNFAKTGVVFSKMQDEFPEMLDLFSYFIKFLARPVFALENRVTNPIADIEDLLENLLRHPENPMDTINQIIDSIFRGAGVLYDMEPRRVGPENRNACIRAGREDC
ncbi:Mammalian cell entry related domain protein [Segniliparus rotundus DSM 44985]|uniref:Mammalian cell entry related domain protein n=1 Tax=Segniliparus rotundus (strain ATCC BAA-972 / CDC 1076 / CIP 108378 / DSM 44985 / JCM 13578) TaxID=640132 RepID=D6Z973_SEGRD|nr:MlaD family protein [Segniliparus rotundus]ADG98503.1 Mammalian cell entry related domain protein [Segniliparus rotundus DSM 44985]